MIPLPDEQLDSVYDLDLGSLRARGVRAIVFDLDNTLGPWGFTRWDERVHRWLGEVEARGFRIGYLSNHEGAGRRALFAPLSGRPVVFDAGKPRRQGFRRILELLDLPPECVATVGDQLFTDVWGAKRLGMYTVLVRPVDSQREGRFTRLRRGLERLILRLGAR